MTSCLLAGDLLTLKALGVDGEAASGHSASWQEEGLAPLSPRQYFSLLHSFCKVVGIFSADYLLALLTPTYHAMLARLQGSRQVIPLRDTRVQIAITHWLFDSWPDHLFALFDALQLRCLHLSFGPSFEDYLPRLFIGREGDEVYSLLDQAYERYQSTFDWRGYAALVDRVQQRLNAFGDIPHTSLHG